MLSCVNGNDETFGTWIGIHQGDEYYALNVMLLCCCSIFLVVLFALLMLSKQSLLAYHHQLAAYYKHREQYMSTASINNEELTDPRDIIPVPKIYIPRISWVLAFFIFDIFWIISSSLGTVHEMFYIVCILKDISIGHSDNLPFIVWTALNCLMEFALYWLLWTRWTITYQRHRHFAVGVCFGLLWGFSVSQILLSIYRCFRAIQVIGERKWLLGIATFIGWSLFQPVFDELIWNRYVMPTHDNKWSLMIKPLLIHIPNTIVTLSYLVYYDNIVCFTMFQTIVLMGVAVGVRFEPFWYSGNVTSIAAFADAQHKLNPN